MSNFARGAKVSKVKITAADFRQPPLPQTLNLMECLFCAFQVVEQTAPTMPRDKFLELTGKAWDAYQKVKDSVPSGGADGG
jgi:hypothetical protein